MSGVRGPRGEYLDIMNECELIQKRILDVGRAAGRIATLHQNLAANRYEVPPSLLEPSERYEPLVKTRPWITMPQWIMGIRYRDHAVRDGSGYAAYTIEEAKEIFDYLKLIFEPKEEPDGGARQPDRPKPG